MLATTTDSPTAIRALAQHLAREAQAAAARADDAAVRIARMARAIADQAVALEHERADHDLGILTAAV